MTKALILFKHYMRNASRFFATAVLLTTLSACASVSPKDYADATPRLELSEYFNGRVDAWGMFQDRSGKVVRRFNVVINSSWIGNTGTLEEDFIYDDGEKDRRVWTIVRNDDGTYTGTADDVIGEAVGVAAGNALNWRYTLALPVGEKTYHVQLDDWMFLIDKDVMINRAEMTKFGFRVGEVVITFKRSRSGS